MSSRVEVEVEGRRLSLSNLDKVMYPEVGFTKGQVIDYYTRIAPVLLPHLRDRPLTLKRYPNGVEGQYFYEKQCPSHRPDWVRSEPVVLRSKTIQFCVCDDLPTLVWLANLADLELHPSLSKVPEVERPTVMAFDLDPGPPAGIPECCEVALILRDALGRIGLESFAKTSGSKGIQMFAPLNTKVTFDETGSFAHALATEVKNEHPDDVVTKMAKDLRGGRVFIDWSQNDNHKTTACVYTLRAKEFPSASTPLEWREVETALKHKEAERLFFTSDQLLKRVEKKGDLFEPVLKLKQKLPKGSGK